MAANKPEKEGDAKIVEWHKFKWVYAMILIPILVIGLSITIYIDVSRSGSAEKDSAQLERSPTPRETKRSYVERRELDEVRWSDWIKIPVGYGWRINRPDCWEQYWFWSEGEPRPRSEAGTTAWFGDIPHANFRLRGTKGPVEIVIEPRQ